LVNSNLMKLLFTLLVIIVVISSQIANGQNSISKLENDISNGSSKQWELDGTKEFLGDICANGIMLTFSADQKIVEKKACINGHWVTSYSRWAIQNKDENIIPVLVFMDAHNKVKESYQIQFIERNGARFLRLRKLTANPMDITVDEYYK
jgi:hypothetical protein